MSKKVSRESLQKAYDHAVSLHEQGDLAGACTSYEEVLEDMPGADIVHYNLGVARFALGDFHGAEKALLDAVHLNDREADYWFNLALARKAMHRFGEAVGAYKHALAIRPDDVEILYSLGCCCKDCGALDEAIHVYRHLLEQNDQHVAAVNNLAYILHLKGDLQEAGLLYKRLLALRPDHPSAAFMIKALKGEDIKAPPTEYVRELFDQFADNFDQHLTGSLEYRVPELLADLLNRYSGKKEYHHCLDLGCGTGLCGERVRSLCKVLSGIDLSANMVERAAEKRVYDNLEEADLLSWLKVSSNLCFDLLLAADVFTYLGDLHPVFQAMASRCSSGAHLLFSVEATDNGDWVLQSSGRYAHSHEYVLRMAGEAGFSLLSCSSASLRKERQAWIAGRVYFFCFD